MTIRVELSEEQNVRVQAAAKRLGVSSEALVRAAVVDLLDQPQEDFERAAERVLAKNRELYGRLG